VCELKAWFREIAGQDSAWAAVMTEFQMGLWDSLQGRMHILDWIPVSWAVNTSNSSRQCVSMELAGPLPEGKHESIEFECGEVPDCLSSGSLGKAPSLAQMLAPVIAHVMVVWNERPA
jgi:hypothetical protein